MTDFVSAAALLSGVAIVLAAVLCVSLVVLAPLVCKHSSLFGWIQSGISMTKFVDDARLGPNSSGLLKLVLTRIQVPLVLNIVAAAVKTIVRLCCTDASGDATVPEVAASFLVLSLSVCAALMRCMQSVSLFNVCRKPLLRPDSAV